MDPTGIHQWIHIVAMTDGFGCRSALPPSEPGGPSGPVPVMGWRHTGG